MTFQDINTPAGHIVTCIVIALLSGVGAWVWRDNPTVMNTFIGMIGGAIGVAFRTMGVPNPATQPPPLPKP